VGTPYCETCGFSTCQCKRGSSEPRLSDPKPDFYQNDRIAALEKANDRARNRLAHYAAALTKVWELLDDVCQSSPDQDMMFHHLPANVYDDAATMRRSIGMLLQGEPWDGDNDPLQELLAMRRDLTKDDPWPAK
jgi:hypothetical protein